MAKKTKTESSFVPFAQTTEIKKIKLWVTIINEGQSDFFLNLYKKFESGVQVTLFGRGTASSELNNLLGLGGTGKNIIICVAREEKIPEIAAAVEARFALSRRAKGIAFSIPVTSVIGVSIYKFLTNSTGLVRR